MAADVSGYAARRLARLERAAHSCASGPGITWLSTRPRKTTSAPARPPGCPRTCTSAACHRPRWPDLCLDWRHGAAHFQRHLLDWDLACNQLNWQWVAGTGTGTDPNAYRFFNPTVQGNRFDPAGDYVRRYVPELAELPAGAIHQPEAGVRARLGYPAPLVSHRTAIAEYRQRRAS